MTIKFNINTLTDQTGKYANDAQAIKNLNFYLAALADQVNRTIFSKDVTIQVQLTINTSSNVGGVAGSQYVLAGSNNLVNTVANLMQTGVDLDPNNAEFGLTLTDGFVSNMNASLAKNYSATPTGGLSILVHEFGHALAFFTFLNEMTGTKPASGFISEFDQYVTVLGNQPFFTGRYAEAIYGSAVPLYKLGSPGESIGHFTKAFVNGSIKDAIANDPMINITSEGGIIPQSGLLYSDLDLAVFKDTGYTPLNALVSYSKLVTIPGLNTTSVVGTSAPNDMVVMSGARADYTLVKSGSVITETSKTDLKAITLTNVERINFSDGIVAMDINGNAGQAYRLYQAAFNRTPDQPGLGYWIGQMDSGAENLNHVAAGFVNSAEFKRMYGDNVSDNTYLTALYSNVLHRAPDQAGFDYWNERIHAGMTRPDILASFSESTENQAQVIGVIQDGIKYIPYVI